jgi:ubiquinone/menaquinone biosynthesis C-methylase UbiE
MVGEPGPGRRAPAELIHAYDAAADGWDAGPGPLYEPLARALVAAAPVPLAGRVVLDLGAGTGVAGRAALAAGAHRVAGVDLSVAMLRRHVSQGGAAGRPVAADATALPFRDGCFDLVLAAFCLNHLSRLEEGLAEARRVGAAIAASTFAPGWTHPAKDAVDEAVRSFGYQPPAWYSELTPGTRAGNPEELAVCAAAAGFARVRTRTVAVPAPVATPAALASWRLGMAHYAPFLRSLDPPSQVAVRRAAEQAVAASGAAGPLTVEMTVLTARSPGSPPALPRP